MGKRKVYNEWKGSPYGLLLTEYLTEHRTSRCPGRVLSGEKAGGPLFDRLLL